MAIKNRHRKGYRHPRNLKSSDNEQSILKKFVRMEVQKNVGALPGQTQHPRYVFQDDVSQIRGKSIIGKPVQPLSYGVGIVFDFEEPYMTPFVELEEDPRPQALFRNLGTSFITEVFNRLPAGQSRYTTPHAIPFSFLFTGSGADDIEADMGYTEHLIGNVYTITIEDGDPVDPNTFTATIHNPRTGVDTMVPVRAITGGLQLLTDDQAYKFAIQFGATTGHVAGDRWDFIATGDRVELMGGSGDSHAYRVFNDGDRAILGRAANKLFSMPAGRMTVWTQGLDAGTDGDRRYYIFDVDNRFQLYYDYEELTTSKLVWVLNGDEDVQIELDINDGISGTPIGGWFGYGPTKITLIWDFASQVFEMYYGTQRAAAEPTSYVPMPNIIARSMVLGNSMERTRGALENSYQQFDDWTFSKLVSGMLETTSIDGYVVQSLLPIHEGDFTTGCVSEPMTPINLGSTAEPFDHVYARYVHEICPTPTVFIDQAGGKGGTYGILAGAIDGANRTFTVSQGSYTSGTLKVWLNGQLQTPDGDDYTELDPATGTFIFVPARIPLVGDVVIVEYV